MIRELCRYSFPKWTDLVRLHTLVDVTPLGAGKFPDLRNSFSDSQGMWDLEAI